MASDLEEARASIQASIVNDLESEAVMGVDLRFRSIQQAQRAQAYALVALVEVLTAIWSDMP